MFQINAVGYKGKKFGPITFHYGKSGVISAGIALTVRVYFSIVPRTFNLDLVTNKYALLFAVRLPGGSKWELRPYTTDEGFTKFERVRRK